MSSISNLTKNDKFGEWFNRINAIIDYINFFSVDKDKIPPLNHASDETTYGVGNNANYGHVKLSDSIADDYSITDGVASTPKATKIAYNKAIEAINTATNSANSVASASAKVEALEKELKEISGEIINHASERETYGVGTKTLYGHLKISDSVDSSFSETSGVAATPFAVKTTYDLATRAFNLATTNETALSTKAPTKHSSSEDIYGVGSENEYGHLKITDTISNNDATKAIAISPKAVKTLESSLSSSISTIGNSIAGFESSISTLENSVSTLDSSVSALDENLSKKAPLNHASSNTNYGIGTNTNYGHVMLSDSITSTQTSSGIAATPKAVSDVNSRVSNLATSVSSIETKLNSGNGSTTTYLRGDGTWDVPKGTTYSAGNGIAISGTTINLKTYGIAESYGNSDDKTNINFGDEFKVPYITTDSYGRVTAQNKTVIIPNNVMVGATGNINGAIGLVPAPSSDDTKKFLRGDGTWASTDEVLYAVMEGAGPKTDENNEVILDETTGLPVLFDGKAGLVPAPIAESNEHEKFLRGDGTWSSPKTMTGATANSDGDKGFVPPPLKETSDHTKFLKGDGTWATPYTLPTATSSRLGGVKVGSNITNSSGTISLTKANVTTALGYTPPQQDTTYSAGNGINISENTISTTGFSLSEDNIKMLSLSGNTATLPEGGRWFYFIFDGGDSAHGRAGFADGGTVVTTGDEDALHLGFAFRVG